MAEWIRTKDETPKLEDFDYCDVIVITALAGMSRSVPMKYERTVVRGKRTERWRWLSGSLSYEPDFWMPLPEPPKEG